MDHPRIACIGAGYWGKNLVRNFHGLGALSWICDSDAAHLEQLAAQYPGTRVTTSVDDVLADPDVAGVAIATPAATHARLVRMALLAGKDVFVEKPLSLSVEEGEAAIQLAAQRKRVLMVGHLLWYHPAVLKLQQLIMDGELGRIRYIYSNRLNLGKIRREENILWSFAPHDISVILGLVGEMPESVQARGGNYLHDKIADVTISLLSFPSGVKAHLFVSWLHPFKEQKLVVVGDRKMAVFNDMEKTDKLVVYPHTIDWKDHAPIINKADGLPVVLEQTEPLRAECLHFLERIAERSTPRTDGREALRVLQVLHACQESLDEAFTQNRTAAPVLNGTHAAPAEEQPYFVHESAFVDAGATVGGGTKIWHFCHVSGDSEIGAGCSLGQNVFVAPKVSIGNHVKIQNNVSVYEGVTLEDYVFCGPSMVFTNVRTPRSAFPRPKSDWSETRIKLGASIGANATIVCGTTVGEWAFIAAGAVVTKDVAPYSLMAGVPARRIGWACKCGSTLRFVENRARCAECDRAYTQITSENIQVEGEDANGGIAANSDAGSFARGRVAVG